MAAKKSVRITKSWHVDVFPEYGDTDESIRAKALDQHQQSHAADSELVVIMPEPDPSEDD